MQKKKKKNKLFIFLIICFVLVPFLLTKGCNYIESLNQAKNSVSEPITSISEQIQPVSRVYKHAHERAHTRVHNANVQAQVHSISKANWTGTAVPNSGYVENIYFNTNLSVSDVENIAKTLTQLDAGMYLIFESGDDSQRVSLVISNPDLSGGDCLIINLNNNFVYFCNKIIDGLTDFVGWNPNIVNPLVLGYENTSETIENEKLSNILSITPFEQSSNNELSIGNLFSQLGNAIIIFGGAVVNVFISMEPIFWNEGPTLIFILLIASVSFALVFWGIELLISLIGVARTKRKKKK